MPRYRLTLTWNDSVQEKECENDFEAYEWFKSQNPSMLSMLKKEQRFDLYLLNRKNQKISVGGPVIIQDTIEKCPNFKNFSLFEFSKIKGKRISSHKSKNVRVIHSEGTNKEYVTLTVWGIQRGRNYTINPFQQN